MGVDEIKKWVEILAAVATAIGFPVAATQLWLSKRQDQARFEDSLTSQYREISSRIPLAALLGEPLPSAVLNEHLRVFYEYFDLCNEQAFLAEGGKLRKETWTNWREGMAQHLGRKGFQQAWIALAPSLDGSFDHLRPLLPSNLKNHSQPVSETTTHDGAKEV